MATSPFSVSASALTAMPSPSFPRLCRPYALLVSSRRRPSLQLICKRSSLVHQYSFGLRRTCHLTGNDPNSKRFHGFRIEAETPSGTSGKAGEPQSGGGGTSGEPTSSSSGTTLSGSSGTTAEPTSLGGGPAAEPSTGHSGKVAEPQSGSSGTTAVPQSASSITAAEPQSRSTGATPEPPGGPSETKAEPKSRGIGTAAEPPSSGSGPSVEPPAAQGVKKKKKKEEFQTEEKLAEFLAKYIAELSDKCIKEKGFFNVAFSGGSLIHSLRKLLDKSYVQKVEWSKWRVFWVDERVVPRDHNDSNYKVAYDTFLSRVPILLRNVYAINDAVLDDAAAVDYEDRLKRLVNCRKIEISSETEFPKFDLVLLGMGSDGHVGSLFPGHAVLNEDKKWVAYMDDSPKGPRKRITMTLPVINASDNVALVVCGGAQADAVAKGWAQPTTDITAALPAQKISPEKEFFWFLDKDAASKLPKTQN